MIFNKNYFDSLSHTYDQLSIEHLPKPVDGIPLTAEEWDYKTYWVNRWNTRLPFKLHQVGIVYLTADEDKRFKIGISKDVDKRLSTLRTGSGLDLKLLAKYIPDKLRYDKLEKQLHKHYKDQRTLGEWFNGSIDPQDWLSVCRSLDT